MVRFQWRDRLQCLRAGKWSGRADCFIGLEQHFLHRKQFVAGDELLIRSGCDEFRWLEGHRLGASDDRFPCRDGLRAHRRQSHGNLQHTGAFSWNAVSGATGYLVYEWNGAQAVQVASVSSPTTAADISGQTPKATEYFYVTAYNSTSSASSGWVSVTMPAAASLAPPANLAASATSSTTGKLSWTASSGATSYAIYYWNGSQAVLLGTVSGSTTSITIQGLASGSTTYFEVEAFNSTSTATTNWVALTTPVTNSAMVADAVFGDASTQDRHWWRT